MSGQQTPENGREPLAAALRRAAARGVEANVRDWYRFGGIADGTVVELQALEVPSGGYEIQRFAHARSVDEAVKLATEADPWGATGIYFVLNSVTSTVVTRAEAGRWHRAKRGSSTSDPDITARIALYIDIDAKRTGGTSATEEELAAAIEVASAVYDRILAIAPEGSVAVGFSGNGAAVLVALENLPPTKEITRKVKAILVATGRLHDTDLAGIDTCVQDLKRLCPAWGSLKCKGAPGIVERPHRRTGIIVPAAVRRIDEAGLDRILEALSAELNDAGRKEIDRILGRKQTKTETSGTDSTDSIFKKANACDVGDVLDRLGLRDGDSVTCPGCGTVGGPQDTSVAIVRNGLKCLHARCADKGRSGFRTPVDLVCEAWGMRPLLAAKLIAKWFGIKVERSRPTRKQRRKRLQAMARAIAGDADPKDDGSEEEVSPNAAGGGEEAGDEEGEEEEDRSTVASRLVQLIDARVLLSDDMGEGYAHVVRDDHRELLRLRSRRFKSFLAATLYEAEGWVPGSESVSSAINVLEAMAAKARRSTLWNRVARADDGAIWIDLCDAKHRAVRITADGWRIVDSPPPMFRRFAHQAPHPLPTEGGDLLKVLDFLNLASAHDGALFVCSLVAALVPDVPQAILTLHGPQGSAKTTAAKLRRALVDPSAAPTVIVRHDRSELVQALNSHYMPLLDNLSSMPAWISDIFCQAATGGGFVKRQLYTDADDVLFTFRRPLIFTGVSVPGTAPDLLDRSLLIRLDRIPREKRLEEREFLARFEEVRPSLFGALLTALSGAMRRYPTLKLDHLPRMADFARWGAAAADALGYGAPVFLAAMESNIERQNEEIVEDDPLARAIIAFTEDRKTWSGPATELLESLNRARGDQKPEPGWPKRAAELGRGITKLLPVLLDLGVQARAEAEGRGRSKRRIWRLQWTREG